MLLQGMEGGWVVIEASHTVRSGLNVTCHMLIVNKINKYKTCSICITCEIKFKFCRHSIVQSL